MYCYYIQNKETKEETCIFGYSYQNAMTRAKFDPHEWEYLDKDYLD